jgi:Icc-related predicted phosphoesterase
MKLCMIADTHEMHTKVIVPECDVLIHAGDLTGKGSTAQTSRALEWLNIQPARHIVFIAGNHDFFFQDHSDAARDWIANYPRFTYLENTGKTIEGIKFWGSPYTPEFLNWAFMYGRNEGNKYWDMIPIGVDVLITHGPPHGILDQSCPLMDSEHLGCRDLRMAVQHVRPRIHVFGHIHGGHGTMATVGTDWENKPVYYNASVVNEAYKVIHAPYVVEI